MSWSARFLVLAGALLGALFAYQALSVHALEVEVRRLEGELAARLGRPVVSRAALARATGALYRIARSGTPTRRASRAELDSVLSDPSLVPVLRGEARPEVGLVTSSGVDGLARFLLSEAVGTREYAVEVSRVLGLVLVEAIHSESRLQEATRLQSDLLHELLRQARRRPDVGVLREALEPVLLALGRGALFENAIAAYCDPGRQRPPAARWALFSRGRRLAERVSVLDRACGAITFFRAGLHEQPPDRILSELMTIGLESRRDAQIARVALALREHRLAQGAWPATLDELAHLFDGVVPGDPVRGDSLEYRVDGANVAYLAVSDLLDADGLPVARRCEWSLAP